MAEYKRIDQLIHSTGLTASDILVFQRNANLEHGPGYYYIKVEDMNISSDVPVPEPPDNYHNVILKHKNVPFEFALFDDYKVTLVDIHPSVGSSDMVYEVNGSAYTFGTVIAGKDVFKMWNTSSDNVLVRLKIELV